MGGRRGVRDDERIGNNEIVVYYRADNGTLAHIQTIATGGASGPQLISGDSLGSQGGLVLDERHRLLFAVNTDTLAADSQEGSIILFHVARDGTLKLADRVASGELYPDSLTVKTAKIPPGKELLYVLNAGGPNRLTADGSAVGPSPAGAGPNITGFAVNPAGRMKFLPGSVQMTNPGPTGGGSGVNCPASNFPAPKFDCGLNPPAIPRSPGQGRVHTRRRSAGRDGQRDQFDLRLFGRRKREARQTHCDASPRAGVADLLRLCVRPKRAPDPQRALRFRHHHSSGRHRCGLDIRDRRSR